MTKMEALEGEVYRLNNCVRWALSQLIHADERRHDGDFVVAEHFDWAARDVLQAGLDGREDFGPVRLEGYIRRIAELDLDVEIHLLPVEGEAREYANGHPTEPYAGTGRSS